MKKTLKLLLMFLVCIIGLFIFSNKTEASVSGIQIFDYELYANTYSDLKAAYGYDEIALYNHYVTYGLNEGRVGSLVFDQTYYVSRYSDLSQAFGTDYISAFNHYLSYGAEEGRQGSIMFDSAYYVSIYEDLQNAFGTDYEKITEHYINFGANEGRRGSLEFDVQYYLSENSDLLAAFGEDGYRNGLIHFVQYGMAEGRATSEDFIVEYYKANYGDLQTAFNLNFKSYFIHYMNYGKTEGRIANYLISEETSDDENDNSNDTAVVSDGNYVDYSIDLNGDGDTTNDWRLFYVANDTNDDENVIEGQIYLITADYISYESEYIDLEASGISSSDKYEAGAVDSLKQGFLWLTSNMPEKSWTSLMETTTNSLFMFEYSGASTNTEIGMICTSTLLNTEYWAGLVDESYADYAIGSSTLEMWIAAWEQYGYTSLYLTEGEYGYYIGTEENSSITNQNLTSDYLENSGYDDTIFFPYGANENDVAGYWLASPSAISNCPYYVHSNGVIDIGEYWLYRGLRPVVALSSDITAEYNETTGVWSISK